MPLALEIVFLVSLDKRIVICSCRTVPGNLPIQFIHLNFRHKMLILRSQAIKVASLLPGPYEDSPGSSPVVNLSLQTRGSLKSYR